jgi:ABC-type transport system involved in cytochrome c biogenesis permease subunit
MLLVLAAASIVEHFAGTPAAHQYIYGSWWFVALWTLLAAVGAAYFVCQFRGKPLTANTVNTILLHLSFIVILLGALLTHTTSSQGIIHLRGDQPTNLYEEMVPGHGPQSHRLPFYVRLDRFRVSYHDGTDSPMDYETYFAIMDGPRTLHATVSMNHIHTYRGYRLYQASYDTDNMGSYLSVNRDPWGIGVTYAGYGLLFLSLIAMLVLPGSSFRRLLRSPLLRKGLFTLALLASLPLSAEAENPWGGLQKVNAPIVDKALADSFGRLYISHGGRLCPVQTFAIDFTQKVYGHRAYHGLTAEQVLASWIFYPAEWANEPFINVKNGEMKRRFGLSDFASLKSFFSADGYVLGPMLQEYRDGNHDAFHKACLDIDDKLRILMSLRTGKPLAMMPHTTKGTTMWYSPADSLPADMGRGEVLFVKNIFPILFQAIASGQTEQAAILIAKLRTYQEKHAGASLPTPLQVRAERLYNAFPMASLLFMVNLFLGLVCVAVLIRKLGMGKRSFHGVPFGWCATGAQALLLLGWCALTYTLVLRGIVSQAAPMSNGYETMLFMAWLVLLTTLVLSFLLRGLRMVLCTFGFLLSGFFLLVSHINRMDPAIGHLMPVLDSPLLSVHVSIIMMSFALLALTFICGVAGLLMKEHARELQALSRLFLYPAITTLGLGIFIGAIWANVSWGNYWTWDPKETWALITFMLYAIALHTQTLPAMQRPTTYHWFMTLAFLAIVMTYFGVNYFLEGMHSYA